MKSHKPGTRWIALGLFASILASCQSSRAARGEPLNYHVALIPIQDSDIVPQEREDPEGDELEVVIEREDLSSAIAEALDGKSFSRVTLMDGEGANDVNWILLANELKADYLLHCRTVRYERQAHTEGINQLTRLPLFLLGGPFVWWVKDRTYEVQAWAEVDLYDVNGLHRDAQINEYAPTLDGNYRVQTFQLRVEEIELDFRDRAEGNKLKWYAASVFVPTGFLAVRKPTVQRAIAQKTAYELADSLAEWIASARESIDRNDRVAGFYLDNPAVGDDGRFTADLFIRRGAAPTQILEIGLDCDGDGKDDVVIEGDDLARGATEGVYERIPVEASFAGAVASPFVKVRVTDDIGHYKTWDLEVPKGVAREATFKRDAPEPAPPESGSETRADSSRERP